MENVEEAADIRVHGFLATTTSQTSRNVWIARLTCVQLIRPCLPMDNSKNRAPLRNPGNGKVGERYLRPTKQSALPPPAVQ